MPFANQHAARQTDPGRYKTFRRGRPKGFPAGIDVIWGVTPDGKTEIQSLRAESGKWAPGAFRSWLSDHGFKATIEEASGTEKIAKAAVDRRAAAAKAFDTAIASFSSKADLAGGDLSAGGAKAPEQGSPPPQVPHVPRRRRDFQGIPVEIDRPRGFQQTGQDATGKEWRRVYMVDYGHIPGTMGGDGEGLDVFVGEDPTAKEAHWVFQKKDDGTFDEYKVMLGFVSKDAAKAIYLAHVPKRYFGGMVTMSVEMLKALLGIEPIEGVGKAEAFVRELAESAKSDDARSDLENFGPPDEWSGAVAAMAGPERRAAMSAAWDACSPTEQETIRAAWGRNFEQPVERVQRTVKLAKAAPIPGAPEPEQRYILGIVLEPETVDAQGDVYSADEVRRTAWEYMANFRNVGLMHKGLVNGRVQLVESWVAPTDLTVEGSQIKAGTWLLGLRVVDDGIWEQVKRGELTGLSIGGFAKKTPVGAAA